MNEQELFDKLTQTDYSHKDKYFLAKSSQGDLCIRQTNYNVYTHAVIVVGSDDRNAGYNGQNYATFHKRHDLAIRQLKSMQKHYTSDVFEIVETSEITSKEARALKKRLIEQKKNNNKIGIN